MQEEVSDKNTTTTTTTTNNNNGTNEDDVIANSNKETETNKVNNTKRSVISAMDELSKLITQLEDAGLSFNEKALTPDMVEQILITDEWSCDACHESGVQLTTCPITGKPHRRKLVQVALTLLQVIGSQVGKRYIRQAQLSERVEGRSAMRTQRRIPLNPQMLLLAFYFVALQEPLVEGVNSITDVSVNAHHHHVNSITTNNSNNNNITNINNINNINSESVDSFTENNNNMSQSTSVFSELEDHFTRACARHLLDVMHQIKLYGMRSINDNDNVNNVNDRNNAVNSAYATTLLKSFYKAWLQFLRHTHGVTAKPINSVERRLAADELLTGTREALYAAARQLNLEPENEELKAFVALLLQRVTRLASVEQLNEINAELARINELGQREKGNAPPPPPSLTPPPSSTTVITENKHKNDTINNEEINIEVEKKESNIAKNVKETDVEQQTSSPVTNLEKTQQTSEIQGSHKSHLEQLQQNTNDGADNTNYSRSVHHSHNDHHDHQFASTTTAAAAATTLPSVTPLSPQALNDAQSQQQEEEERSHQYSLSHSNNNNNNNHNNNNNNDNNLSLSRTPQITHANMPVLLSDTNTSGSENEIPPFISLANETRTVAMGPELPPHWYVNEEGKSRPRPDYAARAKREKFVQLEFKARKAYESVIKSEPITTDAERATQALQEAVSEAQLQKLANEINASPPDVRGIPTMLSLVQRGLVEAVPRRLRPQLEQELRDVMDWNLVWRSAQKNTSNIAQVVRFVLSKVGAYGAPARDEELKSEGEQICTNLENASPDLGSAVASAFRLLFKAIRQLSQDIAQYSLMMVSGQLQTHAVEFIREFITTCLPAPQQWQSTVQFLQTFVNTDEVKAWSESTRTNTTAIRSTFLATDEQMIERRMYNAVVFGALDLLRSGNRSSSARWSNFPTEVFYFEKAAIFNAANVVQESTLLLLLEGTVSTILASKGLSHADVANTLRELHQDILRLLATDITLEVLKRSVIDFLDDLLCDAECNTSRALTEVESNVVRATIDKMTNTEHTLYVAFEKKVLNFMTKSIRQETDIAPLGLVTASVKQQAEMLRKALQFNRIVYEPYYTQLMPLLEIDGVEPDLNDYM